MTLLLHVDVNVMLKKEIWEGSMTVCDVMAMAMMMVMISCCQVGLLSLISFSLFEVFSFSLLQVHHFLLHLHHLQVKQISFCESK